MNNNLLRCDLCTTQLEALAESKGEWWLLDDNYYLDPDRDVLLREWNGFKFFFNGDSILDCPEEYLPISYLITPKGYCLAVGCSALEEIDEEKDVLEQVKKQIEEVVDDAIATLLNFPETQGQLNLLEFNYVVN